MRYLSSNGNTKPASFEEALFHGLAPDGGLYVPETIPQVEQKFIDELDKYSFQDIALEISKHFIADEIPEKDLIKIIDESINFPAPLNKIENNFYILELFHGPTLAFKDFGARFMSSVFSYFSRDTVNILVATSGDTGSAVAGGFFQQEGINVYLLYPSNKVSKIQEQQLTTWGGNVTAVEVKGTFDDCQRFVKSAFTDDELKSRIKLSSANSINIARLLPQIIYYFEAYKQVKDKTCPVVFTVPSGNLGNLTGGLIAKKMGLPVKKFVSATNDNDVFTQYITTGKFSPRAAVPTLSNAMDVGNPSNLARINEIYNGDIEEIRSDVFSVSYNDKDTLEAIKNVFKKTGYILDPHGAVGYLASKEYLKIENENVNLILLETAHPAKFLDAVEKAIDDKVNMPERLEKFLKKKKESVVIENHYDEFKDIILSRN